MAEKKATKIEQRAASTARIIASAVENFGNNGYTNTTLAQIAKGAGVTSGLLIQRYESKEKLFIATYHEVMDNRFSDVTTYSEFPACMYRLIDEFKEFRSNNPTEFNFIKTIIDSNDLPESIKKTRHDFFENRYTYKAITKAQREGLISNTNPYSLFQAFLLQVVNQVDLAYRFSIGTPENDYFLRIFRINETVNYKTELKRTEMLEIFCKEFQSVWLVDVDKLSMEIYAADENKTIQDSISTAVDLNDYNIAREWYVTRAVVENDRDRFMKSTTIDRVIEGLREGKRYSVEYNRVGNNGEINYNQIFYDKICNDIGEIEYLFLGFRDIDVRKEAEIDDLTGLLTRRKFLEKAEALLASRPDDRFDLIISDIVDFKKVNEVYGIKSADELLRWMGKFLSGIMSDTVLVGRYGGDQMVIFGVYKDYIEANLRIGSGQFEKALAESDWPDIVVKFGVYQDVRHDRSVISSCDKAHMALNSIKNRYGKKLAFYNDEFKDKLDKKRRIENSMHASMDNGDFKVYYQPKHNAITGELVGAEALVRWIHPEYGFMNPGDFIPLFEDNGFIVENDRFVWRKTCENLKRWSEMGIKTVPISVNASKLTMEMPDVINDMQIPVVKYGIQPNNLHIEITETLMTDDVEDLIGKLNDIRSVGFEIELDDFGSGYSSINILSTLPLDVIKLDMSFMQQFGDEKRAKVLAACITLAKELGFKTVSEGVEHEEQKDVLGELGVDMIQGYFYSKPLPEEEFEKYLIKHLGNVEK